MARTVGHVGNQAVRIPLGIAQDTVHGLDDDLDQVDVLPLVEASDVVGLRHLALVEDKVDGPRVVLNIQPVAHVLALAVHRKGLAVADVVDEQRDQFLRKLVGTVVVRAVRNYGRHPVGVVEGTHEMVGGSLRRTVGAVGAVSRGLAEELVTVHLVGADV